MRITPSLCSRPYGEGAQSFYKNAEVKAEEGGNPKVLHVALSSDRGLCGGIHSSICKKIKAELAEASSLDNHGVICVGDKSRAQIARTNAKQVLMVGNEFGRLPPTFGDASR